MTGTATNRMPSRAVACDVTLPDSPIGVTCPVKVNACTPLLLVANNVCMAQAGERLEIDGSTAQHDVGVDRGLMRLCVHRLYFGKSQRGRSGSLAVFQLKIKFVVMECVESRANDHVCTPHSCTKTSHCVPAEP